MKKYINLIALTIIIISSLIVFTNIKKKTDKEILPININSTHTCTFDSMTLIEYNGPKAQIVWKDKKRSYYCEAREIFYEITDNIKNKQIKKIFVQDFSNLEWGSYINNWIEAEKAYYVIDSTKDGAMGVTYVPFSNLDCAKNFMKKYGGKILNYKSINNDILTSSNELLKKRMMF